MHRKQWIFDMDGTLTDSMTVVWQGAPLELLRRYGRTARPGIHDVLLSMGMVEGAEYLIRTYDLPLTLRDYEPAMRQVIRDLYKKVELKPGVREMLARLKAAGVRMAVFSNKADEFARAVVARYFDADLFEVVRGALPDVPTKPAPEGTRALMAHLGVEADGSVLYVGDSNVDVETAHNAGLPCCGVLWGFRTREELTEAGAEYLAEDARGLEKVVLG